MTLILGRTQEFAGMQSTAHWIEFNLPNLRTRLLFDKMSALVRPRIKSQQHQERLNRLSSFLTRTALQLIH